MYKILHKIETSDRLVIGQLVDLMASPNRANTENKTRHIQMSKIPKQIIECVTFILEPIS